MGSGYWATRYTDDGIPFQVFEGPMPRIDDDVLESCVYLYPTVEDARSGERTGGSGLLVGFRADDSLYAITNSHVIREGRSPVIRLNRTDGRLTVLPISQNNWVHHPDGDDLAACSLDLGPEIAYRCIGDTAFCTKGDIQKYNIGPGDEVFMIGRFVSHEGKQRNLPSVRFGHIAMLPFEPIRNSRGMLQEAFLVECRSLPGYSGSAVFLNPLPLVWANVRKEAQVPIRLLGVDFGHIQETSFAYDVEESRNQGRKVLVEPKIGFDMNMGMACVIPAWKITDLLNVERFVREREKKKSVREFDKNASPVSNDIPSKHNTFTKADFEGALRKVGRKIEPER